MTGPAYGGPHLTASSECEHRSGLDVTTVHSNTVHSNTVHSNTVSMPHFRTGV
jgi:hypothetical protein